MARKSNLRKHKKARKTFSIIVDGQTEVWYLQMLKKNEKLPRIDINLNYQKRKNYLSNLKVLFRIQKFMTKLFG